MYSLLDNRFWQTETIELMTRDKIDQKYTWKVTDIFGSDEEWEETFKWVEGSLSRYSEFEGKLGTSAQDLLKALKFDDEVGIKLGKLYLYAMLLKDLDLGNSTNLARHDRIMIIASHAAAASAYMRPELLSIPEQKINSFLEENNELRVYRHVFENLFRTKEHTLTKELEGLLAEASQVTQIPENAFSIFTNADMKFPVVKDSNNRDIQISAGRYTAALYSTDREYRKRVYKGFYEPYMDYKNTLSVLLNGEIKTHLFVSKARKYASARQAALDGNNIPESVYDNLVNTVNQHLEPLHRWASIRKRLLKLDEFHPYDAYVTLFPSVKEEFNYDDAVNIVKEALLPLGDDYQKSLAKAFDERWIDVFETKGKRSGAYSSGTTYGVHPYVLLNWNNQLNDVFTLAHEMGHNMHSHYTGLHQPYAYANYSIFLAEVASTANEALLLDYLIERAKSDEEKLSLIEKYITNITTTFYRQTGFAEYEQMIHAMVQKGEALTPEKLTPMYNEIVKKYWGPDMVVDEEENYTWARIPHFYYNFYVYQYATGYAASQALVEGIRKQGEPAIERYLDFLKAGNSDYSINILKKAGVDMTSPEPILRTIEKMDELLDKMEEIL